MSHGSRAIVVVVLGVFVSCASVAASSPDPKRMVLTLQDMPTGFKAAKHLYYVTPEAVAKGSKTTTAADYRAWGFVTGYEADFSRDPSLSDIATGPIEIDSQASVYRSSSGAHKSMVKSKGICQRPPFQELSVGARVGDEAHMCSYSSKFQGLDGVGHVVVWRRGRFKGIIFLIGLKSGTSTTQAVALAKAQSTRLHG